MISFMHPQLVFQDFGNGPPVFILHGLFGSGDNWLSVAKQLAHDYHVFVLDLRNHGRSFHSDTHSYTELALDVIRLSDSLGLHSVQLLGHSMGGKTAMQVAALQPHLVDRLTVVDIYPIKYPPHHDAVFSALNAVDLLTVESRAQADWLMSQFVSDSALRQFLLKGLQVVPGASRWKFNFKVLSDQYQSILAAPTLDATIPVPTQFIMGSDSEYRVAEGNPVIQRCFSNVRVDLVQGAGHWVHAQFPNEVCALVKSHFGS